MVLFVLIKSGLEVSDGIINREGNLVDLAFCSDGIRDMNYLLSLYAAQIKYVVSNLCWESWEMESVVKYREK